MLKTNLVSPLDYFITGLPRSGTTIVASLLNSLDDGFCFGEPHWYLDTRRVICDEIRHFTGKVNNLVDCNLVKDKMDVLPKLITPLLIRSNTYKLGGYKETYKGTPLDRLLFRAHIPQVDFFIVVLRDPIEVHKSQRRVGWPVKEWGLDKALTDHDTMVDMAIHNNKAVSVWYDDFCKDPIGTMNRVLGGLFVITGEPVLTPTGWIYGDPRANNSTRIE